ncbi:hypothetical protein N9D23_01190 [Rubripirellula sp.]|jgi:hypothetical protein|nr:hypothetical protein [Rubripirellula sp.]
MFFSLLMVLLGGLPVMVSAVLAAGTGRSRFCRKQVEGAVWGSLLGLSVLFLCFLPGMFLLIRVFGLSPFSLTALFILSSVIASTVASRAARRFRPNPVITTLHLFRQGCMAVDDRIRQLMSGAGLVVDSDLRLDLLQVRDSKILTVDEMTQYEDLQRTRERFDQAQQVGQADIVFWGSQCNLLLEGLSHSSRKGGIQSQTVPEISQRSSEDGRPYRPPAPTEF